MLAVNQGGVEYGDTMGSMPSNPELTSGVGTALYSAPETLDSKRMGVKSLDKIDVYSFGELAR